MLKPNYATSHDLNRDNTPRTILVNSSKENKNHKVAALPAFTVMEEEFISVKKPEVKKIYKTEAEHNAADCHNVVAFITDNKILLDRYYKLRNEIFQKERGWTKKTWFESEHDRNGKIVVVLNDLGEVVGGLRVMSSTQNEYLSDENPGTEYTYRNLLKSVGLNDNLHYVEVDGVVVSAEYRKRIAMKSIVQIAIDYAESEGCSYIIGIAPLHICRNDRAVLKSLGYTESLIATKFPWTQLDIYNGSIDYPVIGVKSKININ